MTGSFMDRLRFTFFLLAIGYIVVYFIKPEIITDLTQSVGSGLFEKYFTIFSKAFNWYVNLFPQTMFG